MGLFAVIATSKCRQLYSSDAAAVRRWRHVEPFRGSQTVSAFQTTFYSAVPPPTTTYADADVFRTSVPYRHHHRQAVPDCLEVSSSTAVRDDSGFPLPADLSPGAVVVGNGRCPAVDLPDDDGPGRPRRRQRRRPGWSPRAAVLLRAVDGAFFAGSIAALLLAAAAAMLVDAAALALDGVARSLVDVRAVEALMERGGVVGDSAAAVGAFTDFLNTELTSPLCVDRVDLDVLKLTSLLRRHRFDVEGSHIDVL